MSLSAAEKPPLSLIINNQKVIRHSAQVAFDRRYSKLTKHLKNFKDYSV